MRIALFLFLTLSLLFFSCNGVRQGDLWEIPVDIDQNVSLALSQIAEEITTIELELTDKSLINPDFTDHVIISGNNVIIGQMYSILVFNRDGKFVRSIGSRGQGPGEYQSINGLALDERNKRLFIFSSRKIICYDLDGKFLKEFRISPTDRINMIFDANYINNTLLYATEQVGKIDEDNFFKRSVVYRLNDDFHVIDSFIIRNIYLDKKYGSTIAAKDFILNANSTIYLYTSAVNNFAKGEVPPKLVLQDTLYHLGKDNLIPELKLKFKNDGIDGGGKLFIDLFNIYRSSRYVFARYRNQSDNKKYSFCYDTKTGKGYNMQDGYTDDFNQIEKRVSIRPFKLDTEMFYYLHTNMKPDDLEEPNPTLYIGKLKK